MLVGIYFSKANSSFTNQPNKPTHWRNVHKEMQYESNKPSSTRQARSPDLHALPVRQVPLPKNHSGSLWPPNGTPTQAYLRTMRWHRGIQTTQDQAKPCDPHQQINADIYQRHHATAPTQPQEDNMRYKPHNLARLDLLTPRLRKQYWILEGRKWLEDLR